MKTILTAGGASVITWFTPLPDSIIIIEKKKIIIVGSGVKNDRDCGYPFCDRSTVNKW